MHPTLGLHFLAAAEATDDAYEDAACAGSAFGSFDAAFQPRLLARLRPDIKAEGLAWWEPAGAPGRWLIVADADQPRTVAAVRTAAVGETRRRVTMARATLARK